VELDSSCDEAPTASKSVNLLEIHHQIDHNDMLRCQLAHSTKLLCDAELIAMSNNSRDKTNIFPFSDFLFPTFFVDLGFRV
jgi:hypothetical protein